MVEDYRFGSIKVKGRYYYNDVILTRDTIYPNWWRREGHKLYLDDIRQFLDQDLEYLVVGTGYSGMLKPEPELADALSRRNVKLITLPTRMAVKKFNELLKKGVNVVGAFHLTC